MVLRKIMGIFLITLMVGMASFASANVPDLAQSSAVSAYTGTGQALLFNAPNGDGQPFTSAADATTFAVADASVTLTVLDGLMQPIVNFPAEDMWLESQDGGMAFCAGGTTADFNTNANGQTGWFASMQAGGNSQAVTEVMISGAALTSGTLPISYNSADLDGSGKVDLSDLSDFAFDFYGSYDFRSDFQYDTVIDLLDIVRLSETFGAACP
jgi:hypothetical protein